MQNDFFTSFELKIGLDNGGASDDFILEIPSWLSIKDTCFLLRKVFSTFTEKKVAHCGEYFSLEDVEHSLSYSENSTLSHDKQICGCCCSLLKAYSHGTRNLQVNSKNHNFSIYFLDHKPIADGTVLPNIKNIKCNNNLISVEQVNKAVNGQARTLSKFIDEAFSLFDCLDGAPDSWEDFNDTDLLDEYSRYLSQLCSLPSEHVERRLCEEFEKGMKELENSPETPLMVPVAALAILMERKSKYVPSIVEKAAAFTRGQYDIYKNAQEAHKANRKADFDPNNFDEGTCPFLAELVAIAIKTKQEGCPAVSVDGNLDFIDHFMEVNEEYLVNFQAKKFLKSAPTIFEPFNPLGKLIRFGDSMPYQTQSNFSPIPGATAPVFVQPPAKEVELRRKKNKAARKARKTGKKR